MKLSNGASCPSVPTGKSGPALQVQHAGGVALGRGFLRDQLVGKIEVEVGEQHGRRVSQMAFE